MSKPFINVKTAIFIGATVLQLAKLKNLSFDIQLAKPSCRIFNGKYPIRVADKAIIEQSREYIESMIVIYMDTDSVFLEICLTDKAKHFTHEQLIKNTFLHKYLDRSNFSILSTDSVCAPCELGYLKSETKDNIITEIVALAPKCYSIESRERLDDSVLVKTTVKGCPRRTAKMVFTHNTFRDMLFKQGFIPPLAKSNLFRRDKSTGVNTIRSVKNCLSLCENKRWWRNLNDSLAYGHPDIPKHLHKPSDIIADVGAVVKDRIPDNQIFFGNNATISDNPGTNPDANIPATGLHNDVGTSTNDISDSDNSLNFFSCNTEIVNQNEVVDVYNDSSYNNYDLINDVQNHTINIKFDCVNNNIDDEDIICYRK